MVISAGRQISGANAIEPPAAAGAIVPSSAIRTRHAPRASYVWNSRSRPCSVTLPSSGPSHAVSPHRSAGENLNTGRTEGCPPRALGRGDPRVPAGPAALARRAPGPPPGPPTGGGLILGPGRVARFAPP